MIAGHSSSRLRVLVTKNHTPSFLLHCLLPRYNTKFPAGTKLSSTYPLIVHPNIPFIVTKFFKLKFSMWHDSAPFKRSTVPSSLLIANSACLHKLFVRRLNPTQDQGYSPLRSVNAVVCSQMIIPGFYARFVG